MKELYTERAEEIAYEEYGKEFHELPQWLQDQVYEVAMNRVNDWVADEADNLRKARKEGL